MKPIEAPIKPGDSTPQVANLQDALVALVDHRAIRALDPPNHPTADELTGLAAALGRERPLFGPSTSTLLLHFQVQQGLGDNLRQVGVEQTTAARLNEWLLRLGLLDSPESTGFVVRGTVRSGDQPWPDVTVRAFDRDLRVTQLLGEAKTDAQGAYTISYDSAKFAAGDVPSAIAPSLIVRVFSGDEQIGGDVTRKRPGRDEVVDLDLPAPVQSDWETVSVGVVPLLQGQGRNGRPLLAWQLTANDFDFIAEETGLDRESVRLWALAHATRRAVSAELLPEPANAGALSTTAVFYGWFRQGLPSGLAGLWAASTDVLIGTLRTAIAGHVVPSTSDEVLNGIRTQIEVIKLDVALKTPGGGSAASLGELLATMPSPITTDQQRAIAGALPDLRPDDPDLVTQIRALPGFGDRDAVGVARTLRLGALTGGHAPLAQALQPRLAEEAEGSLRPLAAVRLDEWMDMSYAYGRPNGSPATPIAHAQALFASVERQHPAEALTARLKDSSIALSVAAPAALGRLVIEHPDFNILDTDLDAFLARAGLPDQESAAVKASVTSLRRVKRLDASWDETNALLNARLDSSVRIAHRQPELLYDDLDGAIPLARLQAIHGQAVAEHDGMLAFMTQVDPRFAPTGTEAVRTPVIDPELVRDIPALQALFGSLDSCACGHCRSVLSPAAYFVDLLQFVEEQHLPTASLFRRRPDLSDIELSCENSERELPAIDLVNEILENAVALPQPVVVPAGVDIEAAMNSKKPLPDYVLTALRGTAADVADSLSATALPLRIAGWIGAISPVPVFEKPTWQVSDRGRRWVLQLQDPAIEIRDGKGRTTSVPLTYLGDNVVRNLARGELTEPAQAALADVLARPGRALPVSSITVGPNGTPGTWSLEVERQAAVTATGATLKVQAARRGAVTERRYTQAAINATIEAADRAALGGVLEAFVAPDNVAKVAVDTRGSAWTLIGPTETLAVTVPGPGLSIVSLAYQSSRDDEDLIAQPENRNDAAYADLRHASFPWSLPFDLPALETNLFLEGAGTRQGRLLEHLGQAGSGPHVHAVLGLTAGQAKQLVAPATSADDTARAWGLEVRNGQALVHDASVAADVSGSPEAVLSRVSVVLQQARISHAELLDFLDTHFVQGGQPGYQILPLDTCDSHLMSIHHRDGWRMFDRLHRFVRLQRAAGWKPYELDLAIRAVGDGSLGEATLTALADLARLRSRLGLPVETVATWWLGFPVWNYRDHAAQGAALITPLYERVFLRRSIGGSAPLDPMKLSLPADAGPLAAALGVPPADIALLADARVPAGRVAVDSLLTLYRHVGLARALRLPVALLIQAMEMTGIKPFESPTLALRLCDAVDLIAAEAMPWDSLRQVLRGQSIATDYGAAPAFGVRVVNELRQVAMATSADGDSRDLLRSALARLGWTQKQVALAVECLAPTPGGAPAPTAALSALVATESGEWGPLFAAAEVPPLLALADVDARVAKALARTVQFQQREAVVQMVALEWSLGPAISRTLLVDHLVIGGLPAIDAIVAETPTKASLDALLVQLEILHRRLGRVALLVAHHGIDIETLKWLPTAHATAGRFSVLGFHDLPTAPTDALAGFDRWNGLATLVRLRDRSPELRRLIGGVSRALGKGNSVQQVCALLGEGLSAGADVIAEAAAAFGAVTVATLSDPLRLEQLVDLFSELHRLGASLADAQRLTKAEPDAAAGRLARQLLRSRTTAANWPRLLAPITNRLRERQRDALVDHLVARERLTGPEQLYAWFLIDPLRGACFKTTRLLQGISAVQLFVQRCLLGLESTDAQDRFDVERWEWMRTYRLWESNRKVFLYPENWLLPELRDDKSSAYRTLEGSLNQSEASGDVAEAALLAYLDDLGDTADIEVAGMWDEAGDLYVTGRTTGSPRRYFWRVCRNFGLAGMRWDAWQRIDLPIAGTHVIPFVLDGALHIAWPEIRQVKKNEDTQEWEVQLSQSRLTGRGWSKVTQSEQKVRADVMVAKDERSTFTFRAQRATTATTLLVLGVPGATSSSKVAISCFAARDSKRIRAFSSHTRMDPAAAATAIIASVLVKYPGGIYGYAEGVVVNAYQFLPPYAFATTLTAIGNGLFTGFVQKWIPGAPTGPVAALAQDNTLVIATYRGNKIVETLHNPKNAPLSHWWPLLVFDAEANEPPPWDQVHPERPVELQQLGKFIASRGELAWIDDVQTAKLEPWPTMIGASLFDLNAAFQINPFDLGFRELTFFSMGSSLPPVYEGVAVLEQGPATIHLGPTPERFVLTPAASARPIWHYRDSLGSYFLVVGGVSATDGSAWLAYTEGNDCLRDLRSLGHSGLARLLDPEIQNARDGGERFKALNATPPPVSAQSAVDQGVAFEAMAPSSAYNWELFLHAPLAIADHLSRQRRFEEAQNWLHYVFAPLRLHDKDAQQAWRFIPFQKLGRPARIAGLLRDLAEAKAAGRDTDLSAAIEDWRQRPFRPHAVARMRPGAYQWRTMFSYLDNLLAWADDRFTRGTRESIDEATLLYVLAAQLLGTRPRTIRPQLEPLAATYRGLRAIDAFGNAWLAFADDPRVQLLQALQAWASWLDQHGVVGPKPGAATALLSSLGTTYFCVPANPALVGYWDRVEDRLFKIRHCQDIQGGAIDLPLYDPPIDPLLLIRAVAAGVSISEAVSDATGALPSYRFNVMVQKASELAAELKSLGGAFLSALEKLDGERLAQLRSSHELQLLTLVGDVRKDQLREAKLNLEGLRLSREIVVGR